MRVRMRGEDDDGEDDATGDYGGEAPYLAQSPGLDFAGARAGVLCRFSCCRTIPDLDMYGGYCFKVRRLSRAVSTPLWHEIELMIPMVVG